MTRQVFIPAAVLAKEIRFAIVYTRACNPGRDLLGTDSGLLAEAIVDMLYERAGSGLSGMRVADDGTEVTSGEIEGDQPGGSS